MIEQLTYRLDQFEGPLDLLLALISKNKVSITDIPIAIICDQYMEYIEQAQKMDLDVASEFIVMASELMLIKSRMLLPHEEGNENDPRREIADALLLYQQAKLAARAFVALLHNRNFDGLIAQHIYNSARRCGLFNKVRGFAFWTF